MARDIWNDNNEEEFRDIPDEVNEQDAPYVTSSVAAVNNEAARNATKAAKIAQMQSVVQQAPEMTEVEEMIEEIAQEEEEDFSNVLSDAMLRLEQGKLYKMVMDHDIFEGVSADPRAVKNVQKEIRKFAKERMEIMLGMRQEKSQESNTAVSSPFNDLEVSLLKNLAYKMSQGMTLEQKPSTGTPASQVAPQQPVRTGLNKIGSSQTKTSPKPTVAPTKTAAKPLQPKAASPVKRTKLNDIAEVTAKEINSQFGSSTVTAEAIKEALDKDLDYVPLGKSIEELTPAEQAKRIEETKKRLSKQRRATNPNALPMATYEQQEMMAMQRAQQVTQSGAMSLILSKINSK